MSEQIAREQTDILSHKDVVLNLATQEATRDGKSVNLTGRKFRMVAVLMLQPDRIVSYEELYDAAAELLVKGKPAKKRFGSVADRQIAVDRQNNVKVNICNARGALGEPAFILTVWGKGYRLAP